MSEEKDINGMTRKEFRGLTRREWDEEIICDSIIILPGRTGDLHESGFRCMDFVAVRDNKPVCLLSGCSDVIHVDGISGWGENWLNKYSGIPTLVPPSGWSIDCLSRSGLLRMWPAGKKIKCSAALSSFEMYAVEKEEEND